MSFISPRPKGKFHHQDEWIALQRFSQMDPGQPIRKVSSSRLRQWWRRGYVAARSSLDPKHLAALDKAYAEANPGSVPVEIEAVREAAVEEDSEDLEGEVITVTALSAVEGERGWWTVSFDDGSEQKMRKAQVAGLGLIQIDGPPEGETA